MRIRTRLAAALATTVAATAAAVPATADAQQWVGLGDSFAAGPLIPTQLPPYGCLKSSQNFARQAAASLGRTISDVSCSGAKTTHMTAQQNVDPGPNPPQFNALNGGVGTVTLQIGGNDIGFSEILQECVTYNPFDSPCDEDYRPSGRDVISERITATAPLVAQVLQGIRARAPAARIVVVNYAAILPETGSGCWPQVPLAFSDVPYLRAKQKQLNAMLATQASLAGARLADAYTASIGKDACKGSGTRWVEPLVPGTSAAPFHPNLRGMTGIAPVVAAQAR
ncbi:SGNH/GDSL hydrolase family protein [Conexibacter sp. SYSU D00693]|uniref:SGNH/GDSL hydrolase family protein n=1 Tax=Conexibacter sp. SYSU D00693 TaxID=2812560 RepID=UPI00196A9C02|nr:SGNH/GDSL hydrolase family protein [Conexibacter sp. SYSU D00693]